MGNDDDEERIADDVARAAFYAVATAPTAEMQDVGHPPPPPPRPSTGGNGSSRGSSSSATSLTAPAGASYQQLSRPSLHGLEVEEASGQEHGSPPFTTSSSSSSAASYLSTAEP